MKIDWKETLPIPRVLLSNDVLAQVETLGELKVLLSLARAHPRGLTLKGIQRIAGITEPTADAAVHTAMRRGAVWREKDGRSYRYRLGSPGSR